MRTFIFCLLPLLSGCLLGQNHAKAIFANEAQLQQALKELITPEFFEDEKKELQLIFILKVDKVGEIHSAHIRRSKNFRLRKSYELLSKIEEKWTAPFMYAKCRNEFEGKYSYCTVPLTVRQK